MIATALKIDWNEGTTFPAPLTSCYTRQIAPPLTHSRCPCCDAVIYSRRHPRCGVCAQPLPEELLFSEADALRVEMLLQSEREQHRAWMRRQ